MEGITNDPREVAPGVWWLPICLATNLAGYETHVHSAPYLIVGSEKTLLWDTAPPIQWDGVSESLDVLLGTRPLDYVVISHPEMAHCGSLHRLFAKYPHVQLLGDLRDYPLFFPQYAARMTHVPINSGIALGDREFVLVEALIKDLPSSIWGYDPTAQVLFVADGFAYSHLPPLEEDDRPTHGPGECRLMASELGVEPGEEQVVWITRAALYWTRFVHIQPFVDAVKRFMASNPTRIIAPAHGAVIDDVTTIVDVIANALAAAYNPSVGVKTAGAPIIESSQTGSVRRSDS